MDVQYETKKQDFDSPETFPILSIITSMFSAIHIWTVNPDRLQIERNQFAKHEIYISSNLSIGCVEVTRRFSHGHKLNLRIRAVRLKHWI
jgi:hypothetical protein